MNLTKRLAISGCKFKQENLKQRGKIGSNKSRDISHKLDKKLVLPSEKSNPLWEAIGINQASNKNYLAQSQTLEFKKLSEKQFSGIYKDKRITSDINRMARTAMKFVTPRPPKMRTSAILKTHSSPDPKKGVFRSNNRVTIK